MRKLFQAFGGLVLVAGLCAAAAVFWLHRQIATPLHPGDESEVELTVPKGASARSVGQQLVQEGLVSDAQLWRFYLWRHGGVEVKAGRFRLKKSLAIPDIAKILSGPPLPEDQPFVVVEGWRLKDTDAALAAKGWIRAGEYVAAASEPGRYKAPFPLPAGRGATLEGYLYPETYKVVPGGLDLHALVQRQLDTFAERAFGPNRAALSGGKRKLHDAVIMASMLEREEPAPDQRPLVSGILWKRIDRGFPLGVDATSRYELVEWNDRKGFLERLRDESDAWNTRARKGLPPGPIGAVTEPSLRAAVNPTASEYLYYLHDSDRKLHPARDAAEHEANRRKYNVY